MDQGFERKLGFCLFLCRVAIVLLLVVWAYNKIVRPEDVAGIVREFYHIPVPHNPMIALGVFHMGVAIFYFLGLFKKYVTPYVLAIVIMPLFTPKFWHGIFFALTDEPHPTIILYTTVCIIAAAFLVYRLRDYDTWFSLGARAALTEEV